VRCSDSHEEKIVKSMQTIMTLIVDESEDIQESLLHVLLSALGQKKTVSTVPFQVFWLYFTNFQMIAVSSIYCFTYSYVCLL